MTSLRMYSIGALVGFSILSGSVGYQIGKYNYRNIDHALELRLEPRKEGHYTQNQSREEQKVLENGQQGIQEMQRMLKNYLR